MALQLEIMEILRQCATRAASPSSATSWSEGEKEWFPLGAALIIGSSAPAASRATAADSIGAVSAKVGAQGIEEAHEAVSVVGCVEELRLPQGPRGPVGELLGLVQGRSEPCPARPGQREPPPLLGRGGVDVGA